jgi:uncharacterized protein (DUF2147 family)
LVAGLVVGVAAVMTAVAVVPAGAVAPPASAQAVAVAAADGVAAQATMTGESVAPAGMAPAAAAGAEGAAPAALSTPEGRWRTIDDATGKAKSVIEISADPASGRLRGRIVELIDPDEENPLCEECKGELHDQPILGMVVLTGLKQENARKWGGGRILDPENGKSYKVRVELKEAGRVLEVRGYIGFSLLGRTQRWLRE